MLRSFAVFILSLSSLSFGEGEPKGTPLPFNPFANAQVGDWTACQGTYCAKDKEYPIVEVWEVKSIADGKVIVEVTETAPTLKDTGAHVNDITFDQKDGPTLEQLVHVKNVTHVEVSEDTYKRGDKEIACKVIKALDGGGYRIALYLSKEVRGCGIASLGRLSEKGDPAGACSLDVIGYGSKDKVEWGKRPEAPAPHDGGRK